MNKPDVLFVLSVDTEEEWLWDEEFPENDCSIENTKQLPKFQSFCTSKGIRPTYFVDYAVAENATASAMLKQFHLAKQAEIGAHLHPWCNPPFFGKTTEAESHVINLPLPQVRQKLDALTDLISRNVGTRPISFRSGRWGVSGDTLSLLASRGYTVDSSVYPFYKNDYFSCEGSPIEPYWPDFNNALTIGEQRQVMEIPVSAGFNIRNFELGEKIHNALASPGIAWTKSVGALWYSHLLRKIYLSPELTDAPNMNKLIYQCILNSMPVIHMYLHSSSLIDGATGLLNVTHAYDRICQRISATLFYLNSIANVRYCTISEAACLLKQQYNMASGLRNVS